MESTTHSWASHDAGGGVITFSRVLSTQQASIAFRSDISPGIQISGGQGCDPSSLQPCEQNLGKTSAINSMMASPAGPAKPCSDINFITPHPKVPKSLLFSKDMKKQYVLFRLEADSQRRHVSVHEESIEFLRRLCSSDIPDSFRGYQRWFREKEQFVSKDEISRFQASQWAHSNAARGKRLKKTAHEPTEASNQAYTLATPTPALTAPPLFHEEVSERQHVVRNLSNDLQPVTGPAGEGSPAPAPSLFLAIQQSPDPTTTAEAIVKAACDEGDTYFRRVATGKQGPDEFSLDDLMHVVAAGYAMGLSELKFLARGGFGIVLSAMMANRQVAVKLNSYAPARAASDPLYREALAGTVLQGRIPQVAPFQVAPMGLFRVNVRRASQVSMLIVERADEDATSFIDQVRAENAGNASPDPPAATVRGFIRALLQLAAAAHSSTGGREAVAHIDLKPANLLLRHICVEGHASAAVSSAATFHDSAGHLHQLLWGDLGGCRMETLVYCKEEPSPAKTRMTRGALHGAAAQPIASAGVPMLGSPPPAITGNGRPSCAVSVVGQYRNVPNVRAVLHGQIPTLCRGTPGFRDRHALKDGSQSTFSFDIAMAADVFAVGCIFADMLHVGPRRGITDGQRTPTEARQLYQSLVIGKTSVVSDEEWARVSATPCWTRALDFLGQALHSLPAERPSAHTLLQHPFLV